MEASKTERPPLELDKAMQLFRDLDEAGFDVGVRRWQSRDVLSGEPKGGRLAHVTVSAERLDGRRLEQILTAAKRYGAQPEIRSSQIFLS
jgi:hypothetical protein